MAKLGDINSQTEMGREISYTEITATKSVTATAEAVADAVIQAPLLAFDGATTVIIEAFTPAVLPPVAASAYLMLFLYQDGVSIGRLTSVISPTAVQVATPAFVCRRFTPAAGSHTYTLAAIVSGSSGTVTAGGGGVGQNLPAYLRITRA